MKPDYQSYTLEELYDVEVNIDKDAYPERHKDLLHELKLREEAKPKVEIKEDIKKPKRTNKEKIITSSFILIAAAACLYYGNIPGKHGGLSMEDDPYFFWGTLLFCVGMAVKQLLTLVYNSKQGDGDT
ncbi:hypothetical protein [Salinimonas sediminis]|uniref:Uncharacterized protein n=1 Tax=Salinimonas sediminis TaxID=2303538 RepID=A0A346NLB6_9ALTE|nr:hypothetical protein [Salinimonas sediminis]AXR06323.1 hypothetical protein D0Y50_08070 [Salinimonas sediminis]